MTALEPSNWPIGHQILFFKLDAYNIKVYIKQSETKLHRKFSSAVNYFEIFKINGSLNEFTQFFHNFL